MAEKLGHPKTCPTCGQAVGVHTSDEGTSSYVKAAEARVAELEAAMPDAPIDGTFTVHWRLMEEAVAPLVEGGTAEFMEFGGMLRDRVGRLLQHVAGQAYRTGVRDGYVQAISAKADERKTQ